MIFDAYKNPLPYPSKRSFTRIFWYKGGRVVARQDPGDQAPKILDEDLPAYGPLSGALKEEVVDRDGFFRAREAYQQESNRLREQFKHDLFEDLGILGHPKAEKLFKMAWEDVAWQDVHDFQGVYMKAEKLAELIHD